LFRCSSDDDFYGYYSAYYAVDDDTLASAKISGSSVVCGSPSLGNITVGSRFYDFSLSEESIVTLSTCNFATDFDSVVYLYDETLTKLLAFDDDDYECPFGGRLSTFVVALFAGSYVVRVEQYGNWDLQGVLGVLVCVHVLQYVCTFFNMGVGVGVFFLTRVPSFPSHNGCFASLSFVAWQLPAMTATGVGQTTFGQPQTLQVSLSNSTLGVLSFLNPLPSHLDPQTALSKPIRTPFT
jgi:hypothetical protein